MGMFDSVMVPCPRCGEKVECQSKSGDCSLACYDLADAPVDVLYDVNRHAPHKCYNKDCGIYFTVDLGKEETRPVVVQERYFPNKRVLILTQEQVEAQEAEKQKALDRMVAAAKERLGAPYRNPEE